MTCRLLHHIVHLLSAPTTRHRVRHIALDGRGYERVARRVSTVSPAFVRHCVVLVAWPVARPRLALEYAHHPPLPAAPAEPAGVTSR